MLEVRIHLDAVPAGLRAGHYVMLVHPDGTGVPFSLASPPRDLPELVLHYRATAGSDDARRVDEILGAGGTVTVEAPLGRCGIEAIDAPLLILAGGTGVSQARSILLEHLPTASAPVRLYWGVPALEDLYLVDELDELARTARDFAWTGAVEQGAPPDGTLRSGRLADVVIADRDRGDLDPAAFDVLICGGPPMVWGTVEALRTQGLTEARTRADVFEYAPRDDLWG
jgi:CDP-4-dehydro-6-deoxyglucose reductase